MQQLLKKIAKFINSHFMVFITIAIVLSLILIGSVGWNVWKMYEGFTTVVRTEFELENLTGEIVYLDEALTMSARMAAATGNLDWEERYLKFEPQLDENIKKLIAIAPEAYEPHAIETNAANIKLQEIEAESFDLVRQGKASEAFKLLLSQKYQFDKEIYARGINKTVAALETRIKYNIDSYRDRLFYSALFSILNFPILLLVWITILSLVNWYISQRKRSRLILQAMNSELETVNRTLEDRIKERTIELEEAVEKAESANKSKDIFLANITHELRSPLNSILGYTKILQKDRNLNSIQCDRLNIIWQSGNNLLTLINDILDFSKTNAKKVELNPKLIYLESFLKKIIDLAEIQAREKGLSLNLETDPALPISIKADEKRLRQVLINLLSNAVKFTTVGEITLKVCVLEESAPEPDLANVRFEIKDTGMGMNSDRLEIIFKPFEQLDNIQSKPIGTGLGLSIAKELVELMGSQLKVTSQLDRGSTFWFDLTLPVVKMPANLPQKEFGKILAYEGKKRKILAVDDKKENCLLLTEILEPMGFEVTTARNGQEMLLMANAIEPDLILLDLYMPVKTGFTSSKEIRQIPELRDIPIIVITAASISQEMIDYLNCQAVIYKPIDEEELLLNLEKCMDLEWVYFQAS